MSGVGDIVGIKYKGFPKSKAMTIGTLCRFLKSFCMICCNFQMMCRNVDRISDICIGFCGTVKVPFASIINVFWLPSSVENVFNTNVLSKK